MKDEAATRYYDILLRTRGLTCSQREGAYIVGGLGRLKELIVEEKVRFGEGSKPTAWRLNLSDCLRHCKHYL